MRVKLKLPDLTSPKWSRREKLNLMNFKNKTNWRRRDTGDVKSVDQIRSDQDKAAKAEEVLFNPEKYATKSLKSQIEQMKSSFIISDNKIDKLHTTSATDRQILNFSDPLDRQFVESMAADNDAERVDDLSASIAQDLLENPDYFRSISLRDYRTVIYANSKLGKFEEAQKAFDLMLKDDIQPDTKTLNALMDAYANASRLSDTLRIFESFKTYGVDRDPSSFGIVIKLLTRQRRLTDAFKLYEQMKEMQVPVTQPIYSTLISGCAKVGDYNRAWRLFDHMSSKVHRPDQITFNTMIHICARTHQTERALQLHDLMQSMKLQPLDSTFNCLIHACSKRPEYYKKTFNLVSQMQELGFSPDGKTFDYMLDACANQGDIIRAKALFSELPQSPTTITYAALTRCYARVPVFLYQLLQSCEWADKMDKFVEEKFKSHIGLDNQERVYGEKQLKPIDETQWVLDDKYEPDERISFEDAFGKSFEDVRRYYLVNDSVRETFLAYRQESLQLCAQFLPALAPSSPSGDGDDEHNQEKDISVPAVVEDAHKQESLSTYLLNSIMASLSAFGYKRQLQQVFESEYNQRKIRKDSYTYFLAISGLVDPPIPYEIRSTETDLNYIHKALKYLSEYEKYRMDMEMPQNWIDLSTKYQEQRWRERGIGESMRKYEYKLYAALIRALSRNDEVYRAVALFRLVLDRGHARVYNNSITNSEVYNPQLLKDPGLESGGSDVGYVKPQFVFKLKDFDLLQERVMGRRELESEFEQLMDRARSDIRRGLEHSYTRQSRS